MKSSKLMTEILESMASGGDDLGLDILDVEDKTSTKPERGKTTKEIKPENKLGPFEKDEEGKEKSKEKAEMEKDKAPDFSKLQTNVDAIGGGKVKDSNLSFEKEFSNIKNWYTTRKNPTPEEQETANILNKVDDKDMQFFDKFKQELAKTKDFLLAIKKVTGNG